MLAFPGAPEALALGVVAGGVLQALVQWPAMARAGLLPRWRWWHAAMPAALALMGPFAFTTGARQVLNVVAQRMVSNEALFPAGAVTGYALASMLFALALGLGAISPAVAFYARLGRCAADGDGDGFRAALEGGARFIATLTVPAGVAMALFAEPAVRVLFEFLQPAAGQDRAIALAVAALAPLGAALTASGWVNYLLRPFFVRGRVRAPVALAVATAALTALLFVALTPRLGIAGLSWGTAIAQGALAVVLVAWHARVERWSPAPLLLDLGRVVAAASVAGALAWAVTAPFAGGEAAGWVRHALVLALGGATLGIAYAAVGFAVGARDVRALTARLRRR
jgi:putative peptidoglycan lipid II flippase